MRISLKEKAHNMRLPQSRIDRLATIKVLNRFLVVADMAIQVCTGEKRDLGRLKFNDLIEIFVIRDLGEVCCNDSNSSRRSLELRDGLCPAEAFMTSL